MRQTWENVTIRPSSVRTTPRSPMLRQPNDTLELHAGIEMKWGCCGDECNHPDYALRFHQMQLLFLTQRDYQNKSHW
jgi:hypothetical protein